jgi:hypothetical protein
LHPRSGLGMLKARQNRRLDTAHIETHENGQTL